MTSILDHQPLKIWPNFLSNQRSVEFQVCLDGTVPASGEGLQIGVADGRAGGPPALLAPFGALHGGQP